MAKHINAKDIAKIFMLKNKDKLRLSTVINEIEIAEKGLSRTVGVVDIVRCPKCIYCDEMKCTNLKDNSGHSLDVAEFDYCSQGVRKNLTD